MYKSTKNISSRHRRRLMQRYRETFSEAIGLQRTSSIGNKINSTNFTLEIPLNKPNSQSSKVPAGDCENLNQESSKEYFPQHVMEICINNDGDDNNSSDLDEEVNTNIFSLGNKNISFKLREWTLKHNISHMALSDLLILLQGEGLNVPSTAKTIMKTPNFIDMKKIEPGHYCHIGLEDGLIRSLDLYYKNNIPTTVIFDINIDGLPISPGSSGSQFWPILGSLRENFYTKPFAIGIYHGSEKPCNVNKYLEDFVKEAKVILEKGISWKQTIVKVTFGHVICDAPARAFVTCTKGHAGYFGCSKCIQEGDYYNYVTFPDTESSLRTDASFKEKRQEEHHKGTSVLEGLGIGMVSKVPLDYMHLVCLGVTKRLLKFWTKGKMDVRLRADSIEKLNNNFLSLRKYICYEFARKPRSILEVHRWKATELRQFLLYTGPVVLKDVLPMDKYNHFLALSCAIRILCTKNATDKDICYAEKLLKYFVKNFGIIYGQDKISYNVHNLIHLSNDVRNIGHLDSFSAFKYENFLGTILRKLKKSGKPLQQIYNRLYEESLLQVPDGDTLLPQLVETNNHKKLKCLNFILTTTPPNNTCILENKNVAFITDIVKNNNNYNLKANIFLNTRKFFEIPCSSKYFCIQVCDFNEMEETEFTIEKVTKKCMLISLEDSNLLCIPLIHQQENN